MKVRLEDVCEKDSSNLRQSDVEGKSGDYPIYGAAGYIGNVDFYHQERPYVAVVKDGAGVGRTMLMPGKSSVIGTLQYLLPKENVLPEYLCYVVKHMHLEKYFTGATIPHIYFRDYKYEQFNLATINKQKEIIGILGGIERIIDARQQQLQKLDDLIKARFIEMFGDLADPACHWNKCKLADACISPDDIKCGPFGTQLAKNEYTKSGIAVWEIPQINSGFTTSPTHFVTSEKAIALGAYSIKSGDIAMSRKGNVGRCAVFPTTFSDGIIHSDVVRIRVDNSRVAPEFLMRQLHYSKEVQRQIEVASSGAIMAGTNVAKLKCIFIYIPPKHLQDEFTTFVTKVKENKYSVLCYLAKMQLLFDSLMHRFFA